MSYTLEGSLVKGGLISDYIRGKQQNAFVEVFLNTDKIQRIKCFVRYGSFVRCVNVLPDSSLFDIVSRSFSVLFLYFVYIRILTDLVYRICLLVVCYG